MTTVPAYDNKQLRGIIQQGDEHQVELERLGKMPDYANDQYIPNTHEEY